MNNILLYGPISDKVSGGYERMNDNILKSFFTNEEINIIAFPIKKTKLKGVAKKILYPLIFIISIIEDCIKLMLHTKKTNIDAIHITSLYKVFIIREFIIAILSRSIGIKVIFDIRAGRFIEYYNHKIYGYFCKKALDKADIILVEGVRYKEYLKKEGYNSIYFPNCIIDIYHNYTIPKSDIEDNTIKFLYVGRVVKEKGIEDAIKILYEVKKRFSIQLEFTIIGEISQEYRAYIDKTYNYAKSIVKFEGYKDLKEINQYLFKSDFFLFLSTWIGEGHSNSVNEVMITGTPIFYYDNGFIRDIIGNDEFMLNINNYDENINKIYKIISDKDKRDKESVRLKERVIKNFSQQNLIDILTDVYKI